MPSVEGLRENRTKEGTLYAVGVHVKVLNSLGVPCFIRSTSPHLPYPLPRT